MYALDNNSGVAVMPEVKSQVFSPSEPRWFTEGGNGVSPSYPGADWFNIVQAELINLLKTGGVEPNKTELNQLATAIKNLISTQHTMLTGFLDSMVGNLHFFATETLPDVGIDGYVWLSANGAKFDTSLYPKLAKAYPSGVLPDARGEFLRFWDNGRGVDSGRALLSNQGDAIRNITGKLGNGGSDLYGIFYKNAQSGAFKTDSTTNLKWLQGLDTNSDRARSVTFDASLVVPTANENRPRNIAYHAAILAA